MINLIMFLVGKKMQAMYQGKDSIFLPVMYMLPWCSSWFISFFQEMIHDVTSSYADLVKAAFFPSSSTVLNVPSKEKQGSWHTPLEGMGAWLPSCVRYVR